MRLNQSMKEIEFTEPNRQPSRPHFIAAWLIMADAQPRELMHFTGADKSLVSRWFNGTSPSKKYQIKIVEFLRMKLHLASLEPDAIFRDPNLEWIAQFVRGRDVDEMKRIRSTLETAFPRKEP